MNFYSKDKFKLELKLSGLNIIMREYAAEDKADVNVVRFNDLWRPTWSKTLSRNATAEGTQPGNGVSSNCS